MKSFLLFAALLVLVAFPLSASAASGSSPVPYTGEASDKSLEATDKARKLLLADRAAMRSWTTEQWQAWADARFTSSNSPDGTTWRDWKKAQLKWLGDHTVFWNWSSSELNQPAVDWDADDWNLFMDHIDYDYRSSDKYFCVITPGGQHRGKLLLGRWAYAMYEDELPERQIWEAASSDDGGSGITSEDLKVFTQLQQATSEMTAFLSGCICALIVAVTWRW